MIVGIIKTGSGLTALEEFRKASDKDAAIIDFCNEHDPALNTADYIGINGDSLDLQKNWGWDFSESTPAIKEVVIVLNKLHVKANRQIDPILPELKKNSRNGYILFNEIIAKHFGLRALNNELTEDNIDYCYSKLMPVANMLIRGHFKQALKRLNKIFVGGIAQEDIENGYTQEVHDNIKADISDYLGI